MNTKGGKRFVVGVLTAVTLAAVVVLHSAAAAPGNLPAPLGQASNAGTASLGCPDGVNWKGFDANGNPDFGPVAVKIEDGGRVWVSDFRNSDLNAENSTAGRLFSWPSIAAAAGCSQPDRQINGLNQPEGVEVDSSGNLFVADTGNSRILKFTRATVDTFTTVGAGAATPTPQNVALEISTKPQNGNSFVRGLAIGPDNNLWAADDNRNRVIALNVLGANNNTAPVVSITNGVCHPKAVAFAGSKLFVANFPQENCTGAVQRYDALTNSAPAATLTIPGNHPIDLTGYATTLLVASTDGAVSKFVNASSTPSAAIPVVMGQNGKTGTYDLDQPTFGLDTISSAGNPTLVADSGNFRVLNIDATVATATALTSSKNPSASGEAVTFTATITPERGTTKPTGTVQFASDGNNLGAPVAVNANGVATTTTNALAAGTHTITATYGGDGNVAGSVGTLSQTVQGAATTTTLGPTTTIAPATTTTTTATVAGQPIVTVSPTTAGPGQAITISGEQFGANHTVRVEFQSAPVLLGTVTTDANGRFRLTALVPAGAEAGVHQIVATGTNTSARATITVTRDARNLRVTGGPISRLTVLAMALVLAGATLAGVARPRRFVSEAATTVIQQLGRHD